MADSDSLVEETLLRRFVEASRRAEIVALVNSAQSEEELGELVAAELCEAFEAEVGFVLAGHKGAPPRLVGSIGLSPERGHRLLRDPFCIRALNAAETQVAEGAELVGLGASNLLLSPYASTEGDRAVVGVARLRAQPYDEAEVALLEAISKSIGHALERAWLAAERDRVAAQQTALARAASMLNRSLDLSEVRDTLAREVAAALGASVVIVYAGNESEGLVAVAAHGLPGTFMGFRPSAGDLCERALRSGNGQISNAYREDGFVPASTAALRDVRSALAAPVHVAEHVGGVVLAGFESERWLTSADLDLLTAFTELGGVAWRNASDHAEAQRAATVDGLTGCLNHAAFQERLREEIARAERGGDPFALVLLDLDDFKAINDRHGHLAGDAVLRGIGELLRGVVRLEDHVGRLGGDEFGLLMPSTDEASAGRVVDRAIRAIAAAPLLEGGTVTVAAGIAQWSPGDQASDLLGATDTALREIKRDRRSRRLGARTAVRRADEPRPPGGDDGPEVRMRRLAAAGRIGARLSRLLEPGAIAATASAELRSAYGYELCSFVRLHDDGYVSEVTWAGPGARPDARTGWHRPQDHGVVGRCLRERRPVLVADGERDPLYASDAGGVRSELAVPLYVRSVLWGAIHIRSLRPNAFGEADAQLVQVIADHVGAALRTAELYRELEQTYLGTAEALAAALEAKDNYTADHARSLADLAVEVGRALDFDDAALRDLRYGAIFHDIGKIAVPDAILNKPGALTPDEFELIKRHPITGEQILAPVPFLSSVRRIVRHDHERWDGTGYPDGLRGPQIPIGARIVFVVDAYHAMVSDRPYRRGMSDAEAHRELRAHAGTQFDPEVVAALLRVLARRPVSETAGAS